jgi:histidine triad (HIT) family protein
MVDEKECLFCRIAKGEIPSKKVYENANTFAFLDINPRNPGHVLVIPKRHYETVMDMPENELAEVAKIVKKMSVAAKAGTKADGISVLQSNGRAAGQVVAHLHFHVIPRFMTEGPPSLEGILQVKRFDDKNMNGIAQQIKSNIKEGPKERMAEPQKQEEKPRKSSWNDKEINLKESSWDDKEIDFED